MLFTNSFSANMLATFPISVKFTEITTEEARQYAVMEKPIKSAVGHADTAALFSSVLGVDIPANRITVKLFDGDRMVVGQYIGPRLPEGCCELPAGSYIKWLEVIVGNVQMDTDE